MKKLFALLFIAVLPSKAATTFIAPAMGNFDLRQWKLTLPIADSDGYAAEIMSDELLSGYASKYFYLDANGKMTFWTPVTGDLATTPNSSYPRTELREIIGENTRDDWNWEGHHTLRGCLWVSQVSMSQKVIVGQIHSYDEPLAKVQWYNGKVYAQIKKQENGLNGELKTELASPGSSMFCYTIDSNAGVVTVSVNGGNSASYDYVSADPNWKLQKFYFKAGSYCQEKISLISSSDSMGCKVRFRSLSSAH